MLFVRKYGNVSNMMHDASVLYE